MTYCYYITPTEYQTAESNGISSTTLNYRVRDLGWHIERAITEPLQNRNKWNEWLEVAKENGIPRATFYSRISRDGMSYEKAATIPPLSRAEAIKKASTKTRKHPKEYQDLALKNGISRFTFIERMKRGWSLVDASTKPIDARYLKKEARR